MARKNKQRSADSSAPTHTKVPRQLPWMTIFVVAAALGLLTLWLLPGSSRPTARAARDASTPTAANKQKPAAQKQTDSKTDQGKDKDKGHDKKPASLNDLIGRWVRIDGGYVLKIKEIADDGKVAATYFNPQQINVSQASASQEETTSNGTKVKLFVELRDVNYPGCTYDLTFDPQANRLVGNYYQAALGQTFDVIFEQRD